MACGSGTPARTSTSMAASRSASPRASASTSVARPRGTTTTPSSSASTTSPGRTSSPPNRIASPVDLCRSRPRAVAGTCARANTGKPSSRACATSRQAPSVTTPRTERAAAPMLTMPPHEETSVRPPVLTTTTSSGPASARASVRTCAPPCSPVRGSSSMVTANPASVGRPHIGRSPPRPGGRPQASRASDTVAVPNAANRANNVVSSLIPPVDPIGSIY